MRESDIDARPAHLRAVETPEFGNTPMGPQVGKGQWVVVENTKTGQRREVFVREATVLAISKDEEIVQGPQVGQHEFVAGGCDLGDITGSPGPIITNNVGKLSENVYRDLLALIEKVEDLGEELGNSVMEQAQDIAKLRERLDRAGATRARGADDLWKVVRELRADVRSLDEFRKNTIDDINELYERIPEKHSTFTAPAPALHGTDQDGTRPGDAAALVSPAFNPKPNFVNHDAEFLRYLAKNYQLPGMAKNSLNRIADELEAT